MSHLALHLALCLLLIFSSCARQKNIPAAAPLPAVHHAFDKSWQAIAEKQQSKLIDNPEDVEALFQLGNAYIQMEQWQLAIKPLKKSIEIEPDEAAGAHYYLGMAYDKLGQRSNAKDYYSRALKFQPGLSKKLRIKTHYRLGNILIDSGQRRASYEHYKALKKLKPLYARRLEARWHRRSW